MFCMYCESGYHGHCTISYCKCPLEICIQSKRKPLLILGDIFKVNPTVNKTRTKKSNARLEILKRL